MAYTELKTNVQERTLEPTRSRDEIRVRRGRAQVLPSGEDVRFLVHLKNLEPDRQQRVRHSDRQA